MPTRALRVNPHFQFKVLYRPITCDRPEIKKPLPKKGLWNYLPNRVENLMVTFLGGLISRQGLDVMGSFESRRILAIFLAHGTLHLGD